MSSPGPIESAAAPDSWNMESSRNEPNSGHLSDGPESHRETEEGTDSKQRGNIHLQPAGGPDPGVSGSQNGTIFREKHVKPNKVYVGGLPEHTRQEDLQSCFGKIGRIVSIELKLGFGFVAPTIYESQGNLQEFAEREAAEESVAKYHEGYFMGNKIRVELSHGGGRTAKFSGDPGACFKCGQLGHWARECPNHVVTVHQRKSETTLLNRVSHAPKDHGPPPRDYPSYRDDYRGHHATHIRDSRYGYEYQPPGRDQRDYRPREVRPLTPPRDFRDYPVGGPPPRSSRDVDEYRRDNRGPPPPPPHPPSRYDGRTGYYHDVDYPRSGYIQPPRDPYDSRGGYDKRSTIPHERYPPYPSVGGGRPKTPPRGRDNYDKPHPRDYPPLPDYRGRAVTPPLSARYSDNGRSSGLAENGSTRYRRRSQSPLPRSSSAYHSGPPPPPAAYSHGPPYGPQSGSFTGSYSSGAQGSMSSRPANAGGFHRDRAYPMRTGRDTGDPGPYGRRP